MPSAGFEPATPAIKWPQTYTLDRVAIGIGIHTIASSNYTDYDMPRIFLRYSEEYLNH
jgi:hypothetical protein